MGDLKGCAEITFCKSRFCVRETTESGWTSSLKNEPLGKVKRKEATV